MKGDFTRGHRPDKKRGEKYRRVLLQEGRLVLDSDVAAGADAVDTLLRDMVSDLGCEYGSPDLGYLATPGPLLAVFETLDGVSLPPPGGTFVAYRDYGAKYQERFPSIYVGAQAAGGFVRIRARRTLAKAEYGTVRLWLRANASVEVRIQGQAAAPIAANDDTVFKPYDVAVPAAAPAEYDDIEVGFTAPGAGKEVWIGLIEGYEPAAEAPLFWFTRGRYYLRGLGVESAEDGVFWESTFPTTLGFSSADATPSAGDHVVAYLEGWERLVTRIEDPGILEQALGGALDTTVRSRAVGQVKLAFAGTGEDLLAGQEDVPAAFEAVNGGTGKLKLTTKVTPDNLDPCAIPEADGYTGADNRFYRFEVHEGGDLGDVRIKWSKNNGSDAFAVASISPDGKSLILAPGAEVKDGDLIELVDETDDLGDVALATVAVATPSFRPAERAVGELFYAETTATSNQIKLRDLATKLPIDVPAEFVQHDLAPRKVRVWHGLLDTDGSPVQPFELGDGIAVELTGGDFRQGDYWQHEARRLKDNANGPWKEEPHGPERLFAPLALFRYDGPNVPLVLVRWYDHQYSAICELNADDIAYDGGKVGTDADTVQEAIDELYEKNDGGCCDISLNPSQTAGDDTQRIQDAIDEAPNGGTICLERGIYQIYGTLQVTGKRVILTGCPHATLVGHGNEMFHIGGEGRLVLRDLLAFMRGEGPIVQMDATDSGNGDEEGSPLKIPMLRLERSALVHPGDDGVAVRQGTMAFPVVDAYDPVPLDLYPPSWTGASVEAFDSILVADWCILAERLRASALESSMLVFSRAGVAAGGISEIQIVRSNLEGWLTTFHKQGLAAAEDEELEAQVTKTLEGSAGAWPGSGSIAVLCGQLEGEGARFRQSSFRGGAAVFVGWTSSFESVDCEYLGSHAGGFRCDSMDGMRFSRDTFYGSGGPGLWAPWNTSDLTVVGCRFSGQRGVLFVASPSGSALPPVLSAYPGVYDVRIDGCWFSNYEVAVQIGPSLDVSEEEIAPPAVTVSGVRVESCVVAYSRVGVACLLDEPPPWQQTDVRRPRLRIAGNRINSPVGVLAFSDDVVVRENAVSASYPLYNASAVLGVPLLGARRVGVFLADGARCVVQGNVIDLDATLTVKQGGSVGIFVYEMFTEGARDDLVIRDNTVSASVPLWAPVGDTGAGTQGLIVQGNRFDGQGSVLSHLFNGVVRGNTFLGGLDIQIGFETAISENRMVSYRGEEALQIQYAQGDWQLQNNRISGRAVLYPSAYPYNPSNDNYAAFIELMLYLTDPASGGQGSLPANVAQTYFAAYLQAIGGAAAMIEGTYDAQVQGNWASIDLVVGHPLTPFQSGTVIYPGAIPNLDSTLQITGNRADQAIVTNTYSKIVFANNYARNYAVSGWSQTLAVTAPNFDAT
ncbi:MAG: DUF6519 domain-containing protein [Polyangiaceae bacterium]